MKFLITWRPYHSALLVQYERNLVMQEGNKQSAEVWNRKGSSAFYDSDLENGILE